MTGHETRAFQRRTGFGSRRFGRSSCIRRTPRARHGACFPPPFPAGAAPVTRAAWVSGGLDAIAASGRVPSSDAGSDAHGLVSLGFISSPSPSVWCCERRTVSARLSISAFVASPVSPSGRFWPVVVRRFLPTTATPNHALQRTAPRVTLAAADLPAAFAHPAPATFPQPARRAPQSLSLGSLDASTLTCSR